MFKCLALSLQINKLTFLWCWLWFFFGYFRCWRTEQ